MGFWEWVLLIEFPIAIIVTIWFFNNFIGFLKYKYPRKPAPKWAKKIFRNL